MKKTFYGWWIVLACFVISFYMNGAVFLSFTAFFEPLVKEFGWTHTQISVAMSLRGFEMSLFAPVLGFLVGRFGSRTILLLGGITVAIGLPLLGFTHSLGMFYVSFLFLAFGAGGCGGVVTQTVVANWFNRNLGKAIGIVSSGYGASGLLVPVIVWLIDTYGWRTTLLILGGGTMAICIPLALLVREKPEDYGYLPDGAAKPIAIARERHRAEPTIPLRAVLRERNFLTLVTIDVMRQAMTAAVGVHIMPYLSTAGVSRTTAGIVAAAFPLISIVGRSGFGWLADVREKRYVLAGAFCLTGLGLSFFCYVDRGWPLLLFLLLFSPGLGGVNVVGRTILREHFGREYFARLLGLMFGVASVGGMVGPTLAGWLFDTTRSYFAAWLFFCTTCTVCAGLALCIKPLTPEGPARRTRTRAAPAGG